MTGDQLALAFGAQLGDEAERVRARTDIAHPLVVAAGAGAGKTETLIGRLRQALEAGCRADSIVAITFTERAARDLLDKLRSGLPGSLVDQIELMTVGTIHAFCLSILRRYPLEAGLPPVFSAQDEILAGADAAERANRIRQQFFQRVDDLDRPALAEAVDAFVASNGVYHFDALVALVDRQWDRFAEARLPEAVGWRSFADAAAQRITAMSVDPAVPVKLRDRLRSDVDAIRSFASAPTMADALDRIPVPKWATLGGADGKPFRDGAKALVHQAVAAVRHDVLAHVLEVLVPLVVTEARCRYQNGQVSFDDILVLTRRLLAEHPHVLATLRREIAHLCVDEFQDTDAVQYDIVVALTGPPPEQHEPGPVLFAVGDPKQSIYGFRDADVTLFERLAAAPQIAPLQLITNFRSRPGVLRFVNTLFRSWFAADEPRGQVPFSPLEAHVDDGPATATVIGDELAVSADHVARHQADDIARVILTARGSWPCRVDGHQRPARHTDIAVLVRARSDLIHLEPALRDAGIPYVVEGGALLYDTREVRDLLRVLTAVNDTASPIAVVNALRTSVLSISDTELIEHRRLGGSWEIFSAPGETHRTGSDDTAPVGHPAVVEALATLRGWTEARHREPVPDLLARITRQSYSLAASMSDGAHVTTWRRLRLVLDEARWWFEQTGGSLSEYLRWVALRVESDDRSNVTTDETDDDAVHILTVHAAKGLEFPVVIVAGLGRARPSGDNVRARFIGDHHHDIRAASVKIGTLATLDWDSSNDRVVGELEAARLAYVACTRARDHVVVCLHRTAASKANSAAELARHLGGSQRVDLQLQPLATTPPPPVVQLDARVDRPAPRAREWQIRSSWSATSLRQRTDDARTAVTRRASPPATGGARLDSMHAKHARAFAALPDQIGRYGTRVGRAVHGVLQTVDLHGPHDGLEARIARQCEAEEVPARFTAYVTRLVESVVRSDLFARMANVSRSTTVRREMYVGAEVHDRDGNPHGVYGIIDAIWLEPDGFVVVDFKTDHILEPPDVLVERYQVQLHAYEQALRAATGREIAELLLCVALPDGSPAVTLPVPALHSSTAPR